MIYSRSNNNLMCVLYLSLMIAAVAVGPSAAAAKKRLELKPKDAAEMSIVNAGKKRTYYQLSATRPIVVSVKGPGQLRIITRTRFADRAAEPMNYRVVYRIDRGEDQVVAFEGIVPSVVARYQNGAAGIPGTSRSLSLKIGRGVHTVALRMESPLPDICARFLFAPQSDRTTKWISLSPLAPIEPVDLFVGEETVHYYRFSSRKPLKFDIIGPTVVRVFTRTENTYDMKGQVAYRLQVRQDGHVLQSFQLSSKRSQTATYKNNPKLVPGKAREITFKVPKGRHQYEIVPLDHLTLLGEILFPRKDAKLGL